MSIIEIMQLCICSEAKVLKHIESTISNHDIELVNTIACCKGKIIFTGVGKSFMVCTKSAAMFNSLGILSLAISPLDMFHGDLGVISDADVVIAISHSGETDILVSAVKHIHQKNKTVIAIIGNKNSTLAQISDLYKEIRVDVEAGPFGIVPSSSITAALAYLDAVATTLVEIKSISVDDFRSNHPGGVLGKGEKK